MTHALLPHVKPRTTACLAGLVGLLALMAALPAAAQYKVVGPDGQVTYTDRPAPAPAGTQVQALRRGSPTAAPGNPALPLELRNVVARFPVTLYTSGDCPPCDSGRALLRDRGVPFAERQVNSDDDIAALQRLSGGRTVPSLTVGGQALRGFQEADWQGTLDLAGYPRESRLPRSWANPPATPLVARTAVPDAAQAAAPVARAPAAAAPAPAASGGIRF